MRCLSTVTMILGAPHMCGSLPSLLRTPGCCVCTASSDRTTCPSTVPQHSATPGPTPSPECRCSCPWWTKSKCHLVLKGQNTPSIFCVTLQNTFVLSVHFCLQFSLHHHVAHIFQATPSMDPSPKCLPHLIYWTIFSRPSPKLLLCFLF